MEPGKFPSGRVVRLADLRPRFYGAPYFAADGAEIHPSVDCLADAAGIIFLCPKCYLLEGNPRGVHSVVCWTPKIPGEFLPNPGRWHLDGTGIHDLTLRRGRAPSSVQLTTDGGCGAHFYVENGRVRLL